MKEDIVARAVGLLLLQVVWFIPIVRGQDVNCQATIGRGGATAGTPCVFPFKVNGITYNSCTTALDSNQEPWCPTKTQPDGTFFISNREWGYCDPRCVGQTAAASRHGLQAGVRQDSSIFENPALSGSDGVASLPLFELSSSTMRPTTPIPKELINQASTSGNWIPDVNKAECGFGLDIGFIVGGENAVRGEFPFMALLGYWNEKLGRMEYKCGGTLINRWYVVTAAHCHRPGIQKVAEIVLGEHDVATDPDCAGCSQVQRFRPSQVIVHESWLNKSHRPQSGQNDIALIRLSSIARTVYEDVNVQVAPICLGYPGPESSAVRTTVAGWGKIDNSFDSESFRSDGVATGVLQKLDVPQVEASRCRLFFQGLTSHQICAGAQEGQDSCKGDSGGPLIAREKPRSLMYLIGIVSFGSKDCGVGKPAIYTRVGDYLPWIISHLRP